MELRQIEHFVAVAEERHFTRAAARVHIAQSGLSASIRSLEADLGAALFSRTTRRVTLTPSGRAFLPAARRLLATAGEARRTVTSVTELESGNLAVGTIPTATRWFDVAELLARFHRRHPGVEINLQTGVAGDLVQLVENAELDVALVTVPAQLPPSVRATHVSSAPYVLVCGTGQQPSFRAPVPLARLRGERFIDVQRGAVIRQITDGMFAEAGIERVVEFEVGDLHTLIALVQKGLGVACLPRLPTPWPSGLEFHELGGSWPVWTLALVTREEDPPTAASALVALVDGFPGPQGEPVGS